MKKTRLCVLLALGSSTLLWAQKEGDEKSIDELVITSLGIKKEKRKTANAIQSVSGKEITEVKTINPLDNLAGKVSGVQITSGVSGVASTSRIVIRGEKSLNINNNSPLFIIDGVPVSNRVFGIGSSSTSQGDLPTDYGSGIMDLNPEDVESVNVLKGGAAALYGSRAANGVVIILTKKGDKGRKLSISYNASTMFQKPILPEFQSVYGEGQTVNGQRFQYVDGNGENYGPKLDGRLILQEGSPEYALGIKIPFIKRYDLNDIFKTGTQFVNNIGIQGNTEKLSYRFSYTNNVNEGYIPNTNLDKNTFSTHAEYKISEKSKITTSLNFVKTKSDNVPVTGYGSQGLMYVLYWNHLNNDLKWAKDYWKEPGKQQNYSLSWADNPYLIANENLNGFSRNRFFGSLRFDHEFTKNLSLIFRTGLDYQDEGRVSRRPIASHRYKLGMYRTQDINFNEINVDLMLSYQPKLGDFDLEFLAGTSRMDRKYHEKLFQSNKLSTFGIYSINNTDGFVTRYEANTSHRINSILGSINIGYRDQVYAEITGRNDWSSTLPSDNNSYFYPSASLSWLINKTFNLSPKINMLKLRGNWAMIGSDTAPEALQKIYPSGYLAGTVTNPNTLPNSKIKNETTITKEIGVEFIGFNQRVDFNANIYNNVSKDQIINSRISDASGYGAATVNAGKILNYGLEANLNVKPIVAKDFVWNMGFNFTKNTSEVVELYQDLKSYIIAEGPANVTIEARVGGKMGDMYGYKFKRSPQGEIIFNDKGIPLLSSQKELVGNYNPDFMLGVRNRFDFKNIFLSVLFDIRKGGTVYSYTQAIGGETGMLPFTLEGRENGIVGNGVREVKDANGNVSYVKNDVRVYPEVYYYSGGYYDRSNAESNSFDASFIKLREITIGYRFPKKMLNSIGIEELGISLVARNLAKWTKTPQFLDPESMALNGGTILPGMDVMQYPTSANYGVNFNIKF